MSEKRPDLEPGFGAFHSKYRGADDDRQIVCTFTYNGLDYRMYGPDIEPAEFQRWFASYASRVPECAGCGKVPLPGEPVKLGTLLEGDSGYAHYMRCASACDASDPETGEYISPDGYFNDEGIFVSELPTASK